MGGGKINKNKCGLKEKNENRNEIKNCEQRATSHKKGHMHQNTNWAQKETVEKPIGKLKFGILRCSISWYSD